MRESVRRTMRVSMLCVVALLGASCAKHIPSFIRNAEYQFPYKGKESVQHQAYIVVLSNQSQGAQEAGIEEIQTLNGTKLTDSSWSSGEFKQLLGPETRTEDRSFFYKLKNGSIVRVSAHVLDGEKLFFDYEDYQLPAEKQSETGN